MAAGSTYPASFLDTNGNVREGATLRFDNEMDQPAGNAVRVDVSAAQIAALDGTPVTVLAAQGASTVIVPVAAAFQYKPGTIPFAAKPSVSLYVGAVEAARTGETGLDALVAVVSAFTPRSSIVLAPNTALTLKAQSAIGYLGPILTTSLNAGGSGYAAGNTGTIDGGSTLATYVVDTVDGGGAILTYHLTALGQGYAVATGVTTTVVTGGGDGAFTVDILTITNASNGTGRVTVLYYVMALR